MSQMPGIRNKDRSAFSAVARQARCWILLRATNEAALNYIGDPKCVPKPFSCKAKTADVGENSGLVVSPILSPQAFSNRRMEKAVRCWSEFLKDSVTKTTLPTGYTVCEVRGDIRFGCVLYGEKLIHSDYDLFDVIDVEAPRRQLVLCVIDGIPAKQMKTGIRNKVIKPLNELLGNPMVQHDVHAAFASFENEVLLAFGPGGQEVIFRTAAEAEQFYDAEFEGRRPLALGNQS